MVKKLTMVYQWIVAILLTLVATAIVQFTVYYAFIYFDEIGRIHGIYKNAYSVFAEIGLIAIPQVGALFFLLGIALTIPRTDQRGTFILIALTVLLFQFILRIWAENHLPSPAYFSYFFLVILVSLWWLKKYTSPSTS